MAEHYLAGLPAEIASKLVMNRVVGTKEAALICNLSVVHWRRLLKAKKVPSPVRISAHKLGWRLGTLNDFIAQRGG